MWTMGAAVSAQDGTPRRVLAMVEIRTRGEMCDARHPNACPKLGTYIAVCRLFDKPLDVTDVGVPLRCPECLKLDEPDALDKQLAQDKGAPYG